MKRLNSQVKINKETIKPFLNQNKTWNASNQKIIRLYILYMSICKHRSQIVFPSWDYTHLRSKSKIKQLYMILEQGPASIPNQQNHPSKIENTTGILDPFGPVVRSMGGPNSGPNSANNTGPIRSWLRSMPGPKAQPNHCRKIGFWPFFNLNLFPNSILNPTLSILHSIQHSHIQSNHITTF